MGELEEEAGKSRAHAGTDSVDHEGGGGGAVGEDGEADADGRVEGAAANAADGDGAGEDGEPDRQAVVHAVLGRGDRSGVDDRVAQSEGEDDLCDEDRLQASSVRGATDGRNSATE